MERRVDRIQMNLRTGHRTEWRRMFIVLPISFTAHKDNLVAKKFAGFVVMLPVIRHENFEDRVWGKSLPRRCGEAKRITTQTWWNRVGATGLGQAARCEGKKNLRVLHGRASLRPPPRSREIGRCEQRHPHPARN